MNRIKRLLIITATVLVALGAFNFNAAKAVIGYSDFDTFANNPASRWYCDNVINSQCVFRTNFGRTDYNSAWITLTGCASCTAQWVSVGRYITVTPPPGSRFSTCTVQFLVQNRTSRPLYSPGNSAVSGQIEVINPLTWTYISTRSFELGALESSWRAVTTTFIPISTMFIRVVITRASGVERQLAIDDVVWQCSLA